MKISFSLLSTTAVVLSSLALMGCPKKVTPVSDTLNIFDDGIVEDRRRPSDAPPPPIIKNPMMETDLPPRTITGKGLSAPSALQDVLFDYDSWSIRKDMISVLEGNVRWMKANREAKVQIEGSSDERGTNEYNLALGERRAKTVLDFMVQSGVSLSQISLISYGEENPACTENTEGCHQKNRRAHPAVR